MPHRRTPSVNLLPKSLHFIVEALLKTAPQPERAAPESAGPQRPGALRPLGRYKAAISLDDKQCVLLKQFFDGTIGHIFSCGADSGELLMCFTRQPRIRRDAAGFAGLGATQRRYICDIAMERVR